MNSLLLLYSRALSSCCFLSSLLQYRPCAEDRNQFNAGLMRLCHVYWAKKQNIGTKVLLSVLCKRFNDSWKWCQSMFVAMNRDLLIRQQVTAHTGHTFCLNLGSFSPVTRCHYCLQTLPVSFHWQRHRLSSCRCVPRGSSWLWPSADDLWPAAWPHSESHRCESLPGHEKNI